MRIGIDYRPALVNREGIGRYTRELVRALIAWKLDAELGLFGYTLKARRFGDAELGLAGSATQLVRLRWPARWLPGLLRRLDKGVDDLVGGCAVFHHTQPSHLAVRQAAQTAAIFDCIYVGGERHGYLDEQAARSMTENYKALVGACKSILVPSEYVGAEVVLNLGAHPSKVVVAPLGSDHALALGSAATPATARHGAYILTVCRVDGRKNHVRMLLAFERLVREGFPQRWIVIGSPGHGSEDFARALERSPARDRVDWRQSARDAELAPLYAHADAFLFMSLAEGFGLPPLEAMALGVPVIASAVTALPEVLGDAALLADPTDEEQIFLALREVLSRPDFAADLRRRGEARARRFTWQACAKQTLLAWRKASQADADPPRLRRSL